MEILEVIEVKLEEVGVLEDIVEEEEKGLDQEKLLLYEGQIPVLSVSLMSNY